jgi:hypothetical protein
MKYRVIDFLTYNRFNIDNKNKIIIFLKNIYSIYSVNKIMKEIFKT